MIKVSKELQKKNQEKQDLQLRFYDRDQETTNLKFRKNTLEEQFNTIKQLLPQTQETKLLLSEKVSPRRLWLILWIKIIEKHDLCRMI